MIVMISPPFLNAKSTNYVWFKCAPYPNPVLAYFAGMFHSEGIPYFCIDAKLDNLNFDDILDKIRSQLGPKAPTFFGITISTTTAAYDDFEFIRFLKGYFPDTPIVTGGPHVTALPEDSLELCKEIDIVVRFNGFLPLLELYDFYTSQNKTKSLSDISSLVYRNENGKIVANALRPRKDDYVGNHIRPRWEDFSKGAIYHVFSALGCPHRCSYCYNVTNFKYGKRSVDMIIDEFHLLINKFGMTKFTFSDPTFAVNKPHIKEVLQRMIDEGIGEKVSWDCWTRVTVPEKELCDLMKRAGCQVISLGVESGSNEVLERANKKITVDQISEGVKNVKESGIHCECFLVFGQIGETTDDVKKTIDMIVDLNPDTVKVGIMNPWPGTEVYELALRGEEGLELATNDFSKFDKYFGEALIHKKIDLNKLEALRAEMYLRLYFHNYRYLDMLKFAWSMKRGITKKGFSLIKKKLLRRDKIKPQYFN